MCNISIKRTVTSDFLFPMETVWWEEQWYLQIIYKSESDTQENILLVFYENWLAYNIQLTYLDLQQSSVFVQSFKNIPV